MALSLPAVVGAAEWTAGGQAGSGVNLSPRYRSSFDEWLGASGVAIKVRYGVTSIPSCQRNRETGIVFCRETLMIQNERARSVAGLKIERDPESDPRFCRAGNFSRFDTSRPQ